jgi:hypothetical protein
MMEGGGKVSLGGESACMAEHLNDTKGGHI